MANIFVQSGENGANFCLQSGGNEPNISLLSDDNEANICVKSVGDSNRPLLAVMKSKTDRDEVLAAAPKLAKDDDTYFSRITIKADLTKHQRKEEANLYKQSEEKNLSRSNEEKTKNLAWKVIGRRGERSLRLVELWEEEEVTAKGKVKRKEEHQDGQWEAARKRRRGGSGSKSPGSNTVAKTARFGGRGLEASHLTRQ